MSLGAGQGSWQEESVREILKNQEGLSRYSVDSRLSRGGMEVGVRLGTLLTNCVAESTLWWRGGVEARYLKHRRLEMISSLPPDTCTPVPTPVIRAQTQKTERRGRSL